MAELSVVRTVGSLGTVTVSFQTVAIDATAGVDFVPTSGTLTFATGQTVGTIEVPVLNDVWENHNDVVNVALSSPGGGATLGTVTTVQLTIVDTDPDTSPPEVSQFTWSGSASAITRVNLTFTAPLDATDAANRANYLILGTTAGQPSIAISSVSYNSATYTVTVVPSAPLASGRFYEIEALVQARPRSTTSPALFSTGPRMVSPVPIIWRHSDREPSFSTLTAAEITSRSS